MKRMDVHYKFVPHVVAACCTLHNIVEERGELFNQNWLRQTNFFQQPEEEILVEVPSDGSLIRDALFNNLMANLH